MQAHAGEAAQLLKALANERRLQVLCLLAGACEIVERVLQRLLEGLVPPSPGVQP